ncbi:Phosphatidylinositol 3-kinase catalytic subunit type 3-like [Oopsacas minuta]|uniref:Phosphatidylinositol 3-kinase catalytic subunit type 3 n=1 Tax=Oopsacas minuta TaxID=111878 RepID=A0AAV7JAZ2_9METZ|nr:Phosphatidylinositol 3-kinase catalytic subunit type 3-like [Oopsacas minuta]
MPQSGKSNYSYFHSCDLDERFKLKICCLDGNLTNLRDDYQKLVDNPSLSIAGIYQTDRPDFSITCQLFDDGVPLSCPIQTCYKSFSGQSIWQWGQWLSLHIPCKHLSRKTMLALTIWDSEGPRKPAALGGTSIPVFDDWGACHTGIVDLRVWLGVEACGKYHGCSTPGHVRNSESETQRLSDLQRQHCERHIQHIGWLDRVTFPEISRINDQEKRATEHFYLSVQFPTFCKQGTDEVLSMVYFETSGTEVVTHPTSYQLCHIQDPEMDLPNLVEQKHRQLTELHLGPGMMDRQLKPIGTDKQLLDRITSSPPSHALTPQEKILLCQYRHSLLLQSSALPKFLEAVDWSSEVEVGHALRLMDRWQKPSPAEALELLKPIFTHESVRKYAVSCLSSADDEDLSLYLLQLVQAIRYENSELLSASSLPKQLIPASSENPVETEREDSLLRTPVNIADDTPDEKQESLLFETTLKSSGVTTEGIEATESTLSTPRSAVHPNENRMSLVKFLIWRCSQSGGLAFYLYWYLAVECQDGKNSNEQLRRYNYVASEFLRCMKEKQWESKLYSQMCKQRDLVDTLVKCAKIIKESRGSVSKKTDKLRGMLGEKYSYSNLEEGILSEMPLPIDPSAHVVSLPVDRVCVLKSNTQPLLLPFRIKDGSERLVMFKRGDDLRQDQLVLQMVSLMDRLLRREGLDLKLSPYHVQPVSPTDGFVEFVHNSTSVQDILGKEGSIQAYMKKHNPDLSTRSGIKAEAMDNYVRSLAGYCVASYLMGIGDRHLENLLITNSGKFFHIDFGYILGRDPRPFPPPMKLSKEMVEGMCGTASKEYEEFRGHCYSAFLILRRHANLILNLLSLMVDANVPDIALEPDKTVHKVQEKFKLELGDEEAVQFFQNLLDESVKAMFPVVVDQIHKWAQYWRR